jgi:predicted permease
VRSLERNAGYELIARLAGGVTLAQARAESESITQSVLVSGWRGGERRLGMHALQYEIVRDTGRPLQLLLVAVAVVLAAACANLAQLLLVRADARARDYAVRKALGAEPRAILRLALLESGLLAVAGGSAGVALSYALLPALLMLAPTEIPRLTDAQIDTRVLLVSLVVSVATGLAFGIVPAVRMARLPAREVLARGGHVARGGVPVFRAVLIVMQVAASVALCALAGLVGRTFLTLLPSAPGFDATARAVFSVPAFTVRDADQRLARLEAIVGRLRQHPAIDDVAISSNVPFSGDHFDVPVRSPEDQRAASAIGLRTDVRSVSANVFDVLGIAVMRGRRFTPQDTAIAPRVAIVNQALARALGDDADVLGQRIRVGSSATAPVCEIVGIVGNSRSLGDRVDILNEVYMPLTQSVDSLPYLIVKSSLAIDELTFVIRREVRTVMPEVPLRVDARAQSLAALMRDAVATPRFSATLVSGFSAAALVLALLGISGMIRCSIVQRYRELGIRSALGAKPRQLVIATVQSVVLLTCAGIAVGLVVARYFTRLIASQLYGVSPTDAATFTAAALLMIAVSALAAFLPARGASRVDPVVALRQDG